MQAPLPGPNQLLVLLTTRVPELGIQVRDRIVLADTREGVLDVPATGRSLEAVIPVPDPRSGLGRDGREEANDGITVAGLIDLRLPQTIIGVRLLVITGHLLGLSDEPGNIRATILL